MKKVKKHKKQVILIGSICGVILVGSVMGFSIYNSDSNRFIRAMEQQDMAAAMQIYVNADEQDTEKISHYLTEQISQIQADYIAEKIEYATAQARLSEIASFNASLDGLDEAWIQIDKLSVSRDAFQRGKDYLEQEDYYEAIIALENVIPEDNHYKEAQTSLKSAKSAYKSEFLERSAALLEQGEFFNASEILYLGMDVLGEDAELIKALDNIAAKEEEARLKEETAQLLAERNRPYQALKDKILEVTQGISLSDQAPRKLKKMILSIPKWFSSAQTARWV